MNSKTKVFELVAEGGSLTMYQIFDTKNIDWFFHNVSDMGLDDEVPGVDKNSNYSRSFAESFVKLLAEYPHLLNWHPLYVHPDFVDITIFFLKESSIEQRQYLNYSNWAKVLKVSEEELK